MNRSRRYLVAVALATVAAATMIGSAQPAAADSAVTLTGSVECINSEPVGAWVDATNGGSGWADLSVDVSYGLGGHSKLRLSKILPEAGPVTVVVGCGGSQQAWRNVIKSEEFFVQSDVHLKCNDLGTNVRLWQRLLPNPLRSFDISQGVPSGVCALIA